MIKAQNNLAQLIRIFSGDILDKLRSISFRDLLAKLMRISSVDIFEFPDSDLHCGQ